MPREKYCGKETFISESTQEIYIMPSGHPEGFIEAFANIYVEATRAIVAEINGQENFPESADFPTVLDGLKGMAFIDAGGEVHEILWTKVPMPLTCSTGNSRQGGSASLLDGRRRGGGTTLQSTSYCSRSAS